MNQSSNVNCFIDPSAEIGPDTLVWHYARILANVKIGKRCSIGGGTEIGRGTIIGNYSRIGANVFIPSNAVLEEGVFVGPGVVMCDDRNPRAGNDQYIAEPPYLESGCSIGAGAILLPGVRIGTGAMIGAGAIVTKNVAPHHMVRCEPARVKPYSRIREETSYEVYAPAIRDRVIAGERVREN